MTYATYVFKLILLKRVVKGGGFYLTGLLVRLGKGPKSRSLARVGLFYRRKLIYIYREKRILLVAFSRKTVTFAGRRDEDPDRILNVQ
jgi:hypothetical protein